MLYTKSQFGFRVSEGAFEALKGKFTLDDKSVAAVEGVLGGLVNSIQFNSVMPKVVIRFSVQSSVETGEVTGMNLFITPSQKAEFCGEQMKKKYSLFATTDMYDKVIECAEEWADQYWEYNKLQTNINALNDVVATVITENEIPYSVSFAIGEGIEDVSDNHIVFGMTPDKIRDLSSQGLFSDNELMATRARDCLRSALMATATPVQLIKQRSFYVLNDLGVISKQMAHKLIRAKVHRKAENVRDGIGYLETPVVRETQIVDGVEKSVTLDNGFIALVEALPRYETTKDESGRSKRRVVACDYRLYLSPIDKRTLTPVEGVDWRAMMGIPADGPVVYED